MQRNRVFIAPPAPTATLVTLDNSEWLDIQRHFKGRTLSEEVRKHLLDVTSLYASSFPATDSVKSLKDVVHRINDWKRQTANLRTFIWKKHRREDRDKEPVSIFWSAKGINLDIIQSQYLCDDSSELESQFPLALLDRILKGSIEVSKLVEHKLISNPSASDSRNLWFLWAAIAFSILGKARIPVRHHGRENLLIGPVYLLAKFQSKLPVDLQLRKILFGPELKPSDIPESFRKGAVIAYKIRRGNPTETLQRIFARWVRGDFRTDVDPLEDDILARFNRLTIS